MNKVLVIVVSILLSCTASADSFRCNRKIVKTGDTVNALMKKCGKPDRTYQTTESFNDFGRVYQTYITHHVYERGGKKDMIVTVRDNIVTKIQTD
jgi:uncharacterized protein YxeA